MDRAVYQEYYHAERNHWWFRARMRILEGLIQRHVAEKGRPLSILNVGVATGATSQMLDQFGKVTSLEYDEETCQFLREKVGIDPVQGSVLDLPFPDASFDFVTCFDVVEHVDEDRKAASELARVLKPGGSMFVTVPAFMFLWNEHDVANHHHRRYTRRAFRRLFVEQGMTPYFLSYFNNFLFLPIATYRVLTAPFRRRRTAETARTDLRHHSQEGIVSKLLYRIFLMELPLLNARIPFLIGVSLLYLMRKPKA